MVIRQRAFARLGLGGSRNASVAARVANVSAGSSNTGRRLIVASAAPVIMLVAPGPTDVEQANVDSRLR